MEEINFKKARAYCRKKYNELRSGEFRYSHNSFAASKALELTDEKFNIGYGVEGDCELNGENHFDILYINTGDTYNTTICFINGKFFISCWGYYAEKHLK